MTVRTIFMSLVAAGLLCFPAGASQPEGYAGKLFSNPPVTSPVPGDPGPPPVACAGFNWGVAFSPRQLDPTDTVSLEMAIIPFRSGATDVNVASLIQLRFADGLVNGLPYKRNAWNDVRATLRPATRDYFVTVNGMQAGPFANEFPCDPTGNCSRLEALSIRGGLFEESVAWIDSLSLVRDTAAGQDVILKNGFDLCSTRDVFFGGLLIVVPPKNLISAGAR